jgi:hypothetical protein
MRTRLISDEDTTTSHCKGLELATIRKGGVVELLFGPPQPLVRAFPIRTPTMTEPERPRERLTTISSTKSQSR